MTILILHLDAFCMVAFDKKDGPLTPEEEEQRSTIKRKVLGNIRFIGRLRAELSRQVSWK